MVSCINVLFSKVSLFYKVFRIICNKVTAYCLGYFDFHNTQSVAIFYYD